MWYYDSYYFLLVVPAMLIALWAQFKVKSTYNKYLHPDLLDYNSKEMFDMLGKGEVLSVFQFSTEDK